MAASSGSFAVWFDLQNRGTINVTSYTLESGYFTSTDGFSFSLYETDRALARNLELQPVSLFVDGNQQLFGRIEKTSVGGNGHEVMCSGRDYLAELVECDVDPTIKLKDQTTLAQAVLLAAAPVGIDAVEFTGTGFRNVRTGINIDTGESDATFREAKLDEYKAKPGQSIFDFLNQIMARHSATIQPTPDRNRVALAAPDYTQSPSYRIVRHARNPAGEANNVISATADRDFSKFPTYVLATGKQGSSGEAKSNTSADGRKGVSTVIKEGAGGGKTIESIMQQLLPDRNASLIHTGRLKPGELKPNPDAVYRLMYLRDEQAKNQNQLDHALVRATAELLKDTLRYSVTLRGHVDPGSGAVFAPDTIVEVNDDVCQVNERLWVESRTLSYDERNGATTSLECWRIGSFII